MSDSAGAPVDSGIRVVLVTAPGAGAAEELTEQLVNEGLAACGNLVPGLLSIYFWEGKVRRDEEVLLILKTTRVRADELTRRIAELHPYDVPEVLVLTVESGNETYLRWVSACVGSDA